MTYPETLDYLFTQLPMFQRQGAAAMKKDLTNIRILLDWLGNPHERLPCVHVAGTNGKGTVCHLIAAALQQQGYRVAMYTSPHYKDFRERIKINGTFIPEQDVIDFTARLRDAGLSVDASFFEITVAMAFDYFAREAPDFCVVEVGLGGRLDSTNIITPILSVITNIGLDHTQFLGETLPEIAGEKAGIIKAGVPVVVGKRQPETTLVYTRKASDNSTTLNFAEDSYEWRPTPPAKPSTDSDYHLYAHGEPQPIPFSPGSLKQSPTQRENMITALVSLAELAERGLYKMDFRELETAWLRLGELTYYIGRFQTLSKGDGPLCLADSAHNEDGLRQTIPWLLSYNRPLHVVLGMVSDKDHGKVLTLLPPAARYYFVKADIPRGLPATELQEKGKEFGLVGQAYPSVAAGYAAARAEATDEELVFVGGSIFTVAEVL
ncbi:bifunctional folylpolyglutamate synthase/dihydrofolate synthase [Neolewinella antarctica]|uniref:Dihydrofolate synthase/folylpolyglutamate synthase n=1 Tax=Neolewinella antarctica TaxID=442734 RepID=A0ABX0XAY3_9BACT|nr:Mur ligase family protein [Neolewinella antarctica]NJC26439.1 dihydrofolate synthase/folylpolyglutamate synthase [Neolewinella antarctica]